MRRLKSNKLCRMKNDSGLAEYILSTMNKDDSSEEKHHDEPTLDYKTDESESAFVNTSVDNPGLSSAIVGCEYLNDTGFMFHHDDPLEMFGYSPFELLGKDLGSFQFAAPPESLKCTRNRIAREGEQRFGQNCFLLNAEDAQFVESIDKFVQARGTDRFSLHCYETMVDSCYVDGIEKRINGALSALQDFVPTQTELFSCDVVCFVKYQGAKSTFKLALISSGKSMGIQDYQRFCSTIYSEVVRSISASKEVYSTLGEAICII